MQVPRRIYVLLVSTLIGGVIASVGLPVMFARGNMPILAAMLLGASMTVAIGFAVLAVIIVFEIKPDQQPRSYRVLILATLTLTFLALLLLQDVVGHVVSPDPGQAWPRPPAAQR